ncbi:hypothetical protein EYZ11_001689 [Aspergillus tanneri]|uniref:Uncharacterized protein n=1 Tax=Aspergillus tanneri TaxID=1220188 RepID=A0A4S3JSR9_9EURO|nr:hypothetical protein EYZ11_001689 [Aspergillus tanneri]
MVREQIPHDSVVLRGTGGRFPGAIERWKKLPAECGHGEGGYGKASRAEWGIEIMKYLQGRRQLRRAFLLIDSLHGIKKTDEEILRLFRSYAIPHQIVLSKVDKVLAKKRSKVKSGVSADNVASLQNMLQGLRPVIQPDGHVEGPGALGEILTCSAETMMGRGRALGVSALRWAILSAAGFDANVEVKSEPVSLVSTISTATP